MASNSGEFEVIIKKVKKGGGHGHHGGAWKVAYADFVTAMMAFFLLLWLLNATTEEQKKGISDYFAPSNVSTSPSGAGGLLGGKAISKPGGMTSGSATPSISIPLSPSEGESEHDVKGDTDTADGGQTPLDANRGMTQEDADALIAKREDESFDEAEQELKQAIQSVPQLQEMAENLLIDRTPEGLRIQVVDQEGKAMFASGSARMPERTRALMAQISKVISKLPNRISVTGHTDATPYRGARRGYGNWELSSDRALASRRALVEAGLPMKRIAMVVGRADEDPLVPDDPKSARNRRISIVILRKSADKGATAAKPAAPEFKPDWTGPRVK